MTVVTNQNDDMLVVLGEGCVVSHNGTEITCYTQSKNSIEITLGMYRSIEAAKAVFDDLRDVLEKGRKYYEMLTADRADTLAACKKEGVMRI